LVIGIAFIHGLGGSDVVTIRPHRWPTMCPR